MDNTTWHDQRPSHPPIPMKVRVAEKHYEIAQRVYDEAVNRYLDYGEWDQEHLEVLGHRADDAYENMLKAKHDALNPCQHENVSMVGHHYFIAGEVDDDIEEVCQDCGKAVG